MVVWSGGDEGTGSEAGLGCVSRGCDRFALAGDRSLRGVVVEVRRGVLAGVGVVGRAMRPIRA